MLKKVSGLGRLTLTKNNSSMMHEYEKHTLKKPHLHPISTYCRVLQCMTYTNTYFKDKLIKKGFNRQVHRNARPTCAASCTFFFFMSSRCLMYHVWPELIWLLSMSTANHFDIRLMSWQMDVFYFIFYYITAKRKTFSHFDWGMLTRMIF